jgi:hypothetical protein
MEGQRLCWTRERCYFFLCGQRLEEEKDDLEEEAGKEERKEEGEGKQARGEGVLCFKFTVLIA